ncbi:MAG TPA: hypothetical protein DCR97_03920, partial [Deltaproteobacteria bacterium]|nr:hypothetical protein [Deltaproteobacteria bacterium]
QGLGASAREGSVQVPFFKKRCTVKSDGVYLDEARLGPIPSIVVVRYLLGAGDDPIFNLWVPFRDLRDCAQMGLYVQSKVEERIVRFCGGRKEYLTERLTALGGNLYRTGSNPDLAVALQPFPRIPLLTLFWDSDGESSGSFQFLLDKSARSYLDVESLVGLLDYIRFKIEE